MTAAPQESFAQRMKRERQEREAAERGFDIVADTATPAPSDPLWGRRAAAYCRAALDGVATELAAMPEDSGRNQVLNDNALRAYRWSLAGHLAATDVTDQLRNAGTASGLPLREVDATLKSAWTGAQRYGADHPRLAERPFPAPSVPAAGPEGSDEAAVIAGEELPTAEDAMMLMVAAKVRELRVLELARKVLLAEQHEAEFRIPPSTLTLREQLLLPREPTTYSVESLLPAGGNVLLAAAFKSGKSTLMLNLIKSFADDLPFLGRYAIHSAPGRIAIFNYELAQSQFDEWLEQAGIVNQDRVSVLHLRGYRMPLTVPKVEDWIVGWLKDHDVSMWIADPFARAAVGTDENGNTEVGQWLDTFDVIKERAGVRDGLLPTHTGRAEMAEGQERARGATRLDDWADARWILTKDDDGNRFFRATGRDVEVEEERLAFDPATRALTIGGGDRKWVARRRVEQRILEFVAAKPGAAGAEVVAGVEGGTSQIGGALKGLCSSGHLRGEPGKGTRVNYFATGKELPS